MELKEQFRKEYFAKAKEDGCEVDGQMFVVVEKDLYMKWLETKLQNTSSNSEYAKLPSLHDVMDIIRPNGAGQEIPEIVRRVYETIKKLGDFA